MRELFAFFVSKQAGQCRLSTGTSWLTTELSERRTRGSRDAPERGLSPRWRRCPRRRAAAGHLQALLSSTLTARGLMAPVRFTCEAAEGASCSVTAPRLGFSSTRFAC